MDNLVVGKFYLLEHYLCGESSTSTLLLTHNMLIIGICSVIFKSYVYIWPTLKLNLSLFQVINISTLQLEHLFKLEHKRVYNNTTLLCGFLLDDVHIVALKTYTPTQKSIFAIGRSRCILGMESTMICYFLKYCKI